MLDGVTIPPYQLGIMAHVTGLAQHILTLEPDKDAARLCFYHYLKNLCDATEPVSPELISRFFSRALSFSHWQEEKQRLFLEVATILQHYQDTSGENLQLHEMIHPSDVQIVPVETLQTMEHVIGRFFEKHSTSFDHFRILADRDQSVVAIALQRDRSLRVTQFPKVLAIRGGELTPLTLDFTLFYSSDLNLHSQVVQNLEVGAHTSARFFLDRDPQGGPEGVYGTVVRGYTFQRYAVMDGGSLHRYPFLFYPLKRLEQLFVNRKSDPMYLELTSILEKALDLLGSRHPESLKFGEAALERGRLALEHIFPDDKLVRLLISNLDKTLALEYSNAQLHRPRAQSNPSGFLNESGGDLLGGPDGDPNNDPNNDPKDELSDPNFGTEMKDETWPKTPSFNL